jgi:hypothetical protein
LTRRAILVGALLCFGSLDAAADPWLPPGDEALRSDILFLADRGVLRGPVTTWPLSWPDLARDVLGENGQGFGADATDVLLRVQRLARAASTPGRSDNEVRVSGAYRPTPFRSFADSPREEGELEVRRSWLGQYLAINLQSTLVVDPVDGKKFRPDGSYLGVNIGNFMISAGFMERWWGPGWDGNLILSTNARPIPSITIERNYTDAFKFPLLKWLGPWRASIAVGEAEGHDVAVPNVRFLAARVNLKPRPWIELGVTRTAQWCGGDRECGWSTFTDMLLGRDNQITNGTSDDQPGNQMAGYDMRVSSPWRALPVALYTQWIGEDEAGGLPSKFIGQVGAEGWMTKGFGLLRARVEYTDTTCNFTRETPEFDCAYRNAIYPQGYTYRGRNIGHSIDRDGRMYSVGMLLTRPSGEHMALTLRRLQLNRGDGPHPISDAPLEFEDVELRYSRQFGFGNVRVGIGYSNADGSSRLDPGVRGYMSWQQGF